MACKIQAYLNDVKGRVLEALPETKDIAKTSLKLIKTKTGKDTVAKVEMFLLHKHLGEGKAYNGLTTKSGGKFDVVIKDVRLEEDGSLTVEASKVGETKRYTYKGVDVNTGVSSKGSKFELIEGLGVKVFGSRTYTVSGFNKPLENLAGPANEHVSRMLVGLGVKGNESVSPYLKKWHRQLKVKSSIYAESVRLLDKGFSDEGVWGKIKAFTFTTGDINRENMNKLLSIVNTVQRRNVQILDSKMPELDRKVNRTITNKQIRNNIDQVFGKIALGNLLDVAGLWNEVETGAKSIEELVKGLNLDNNEKLRAKYLAEAMVDGKYTGGVINSGRNKKVGAAATLISLGMNDGKLLSTFKYVHKKHPELYVELRQMAIINKDMNESVNSGLNAESLTNDSTAVYNGYEESGTVDVYDQQLEMRFLDAQSISDIINNQSTEVWTVVRDATDTSLGVISRTALASSMTGLGTGINRVKNGIPLESKFVEAELAKDRDWMNKNNVIMDTDNGYARYRVMLTTAEKEKAGIRGDVAHTLYRTYVHNKELIETRTARSLIVDSMVEAVKTDTELAELERKLRSNSKKKREDRVEIPVFLKSTWLGDKEMSEKYPYIYKKYKPARGLSDYGNFSKSITHVRKDMSDMVIGYKQDAFLKDEWPTFQEWERYYKQLVQMLKIKLVVASPAKLAVDVASNNSILMTTGMSPVDAWKWSNEALKLSGEMSKLENELVRTNLDLVMAKADGADTTKLEEAVKKAEEAILSHEYNDAIKFGFIQSEGTELMLKEFDTISGLQHSIDTLLGKAMTDNKGDTTGIHKAITWWMEAGFGVDDIVKAVGTSSMIKGTSFGEELVGIGDRLANKKPRIKAKEKELGRKLTAEEVKDLEDSADTVRYVAELLASPSSEIVRQGSRVMQLGDIMAKWSLYKYYVQKYSEQYMKEYKTSGVPVAELQKIKDRAGIEASDMFIDYRINMPKEIKVLSDLGIMMFPSFWIRAQKIVWNLGKNYPVNVGVGYVVADLLGMEGASIVDANIINKASEGTLISAGQDVLNLGTLVVGAR